MKKYLLKTGAILWIIICVSFMVKSNKVALNKEKWISLYVSRWLKASVVNEDGAITEPKSGTPQGGVISPLLANLYLHVVFDGWMLENYPGIRFERYADDIIIYARREQIAQSILHKLHHRFAACGLTIHPTKTQIVCLTRNPLNKDERKFRALKWAALYLHHNG